ncbi:MAG: hypothetical protein JSW10_03810 [Pseudomonadota bacterium]|nr:MAG: hypothetical protein JSW10_03810 [Pseudomonadota bacterium]
MRYPDKVHKTMIFVSFSSILAVGTAFAESESDAAFAALDRWQTNRLLHPTNNERSRERGGHIVIYDNLKDVTVEQALDEHFDRIENMMFTRILITDEAGQVQRDPASGRLLMEDDGC